MSLFCALQKENDISAIWHDAGPQGAMHRIWPSPVITLLLGIHFPLQEMPVSLASQNYTEIPEVRNTL